MAAPDVTGKLLVIECTVPASLAGLEQLLKQHGEVTRFDVKSDVALVVYTSAAVASTVHQDLDGHDLGAGGKLTIRLPTAIEESVVVQAMQLEMLQNLLQGLTSSAARSAAAVDPAVQAGALGVQEAAPTSVSSTTPTPPSTNVLSAQSYHHVPKLPFFSGSSDRKDEATFDYWAFEVRALIDEATYPPALLSQAVRRSLRGSASRVLLHLGQGASVEAIVDKLEGIYGTVVSDAALLQQFYGEAQRDDENVAGWGSRLEDLMAQLKVRGKASASTSDEMLRNKFWCGLRSERVKTATRHRFDATGSYMELLAYVRSVEQEFQDVGGPKGRATNQVRSCPQTAAPPVEKPEMKLEEIVAAASNAAVQAVQPMVEKVAKLLEAHQASQVREPAREVDQERRPRGPLRCFRCGGTDHFIRECPVAPQGNGQPPMPGSRQ